MNHVVTFQNHSGISRLDGDDDPSWIWSGDGDGAANPRGATD